jgi:hypothetical protein
MGRRAVAVVFSRSIGPHSEALGVNEDIGLARRCFAGAGAV